MNVTFVLVGVATLLAAWRKLADHPLPLLVIGAFALSLVLMGFYRHEPLVAGGETNSFEAGGTRCSRRRPVSPSCCSPSR